MPLVAPRAMRAAAAVVTACRAGRTTIPTLRSAPPLTLRQTGPYTVHLISTAAGPLGGDQLELDLDVAPHTTLEVRSVASTLVLPGAGRSAMRVSARVGAGATLRFVPEPTVLAAGCDHILSVRLALDPAARAVWREEIVLGRHGERPGRCRTRFDATVGGRPLLRQELSLGTGLDASPAVLAGATCVGNTLLAGDRPQTAVVGDGVGDGVVVLPLAGPGVLVSALAGDAVELRARLEWGESRARESR
ncbi:urease accessory protein UreD [Nonomuraea sp. SBT364]|uniref:urease accessory protein UreD n=1 Tax=Nonomuraea sp. SBT364 TaxID=1580530 RepID=UPI0007C6D2AC|nr:urease accessory protein UreD [Nonomuraea sp. SBT364]